MFAMRTKVVDFAMNKKLRRIKKIEKIKIQSHVFAIYIFGHRLLRVFGNVDLILPGVWRSLHHHV